MTRMILPDDPTRHRRAHRSSLQSSLHARQPKPPPRVAPTRRSSAAGRNVIERSFNDHKQWRGITTRCDKLATLYRGAVVLRDITNLADDLGDTP
jgi:transposase